MNLRHTNHQYTQGLHELGNNLYAWLQPDGGWGWSNAGMICDSGQSLLVDTLYDVPLTETMLRAYRGVAPDSMRDINLLINTHRNGDHCNGNCCCGEARIIAHRNTRDKMLQESPAMMAGLLEGAADMGELGAYLTHCFGAFDFASVRQTLPTQVFDDELSLSVGTKRVQLKYVGPAHTDGDILVYVPDDKTLYTGDMLFIEGHPILWDGPVQNWLDACEYMLGLDVDAIVPGHGPITNKTGVRAVYDYFAYISSEARRRFEAGMSYEEAARDIALTDYDSWGDAERIIINCATLYREFGGDAPSDTVAIFTAMSKLFYERRR